MTVELVARDRWRPLGGGDICEVWRACTTDGRDVAVKRTPYDARLEADGLRALADAGAPVPEVLDVTSEQLVIAHLSGPPRWEALGAALAQAHRWQDPRVGERFGWHIDNHVGAAPQANETGSDWPRFYAEQRIRPHLGARALPDGLQRRLLVALDGPLHELLATDDPPGLVHGDLWAGNVLDGAWLIDPAVHHAHRELDLAFAEVFGGFPDAFWRGYADAWPLGDGWQRRRPALQLHHLLVHVRLFGSGYVGAVTARLDALGW